MLHVELRERISTFRLCSSLKRSLASSGTNFALFGSSKIAAATARQKSTSKPVQLPLSSGMENPGSPALTPHNTAPHRALQGAGVVEFIKNGEGSDQIRDREPDQQAASKCTHD